MQGKAMITNKDRSGWFGASDASYIVAKNRKTKSWATWWMEKLDLYKRDFVSKAMKAGTAWEHPILNAVNEKARKDHQIIIEKLGLRVNLDSDLDGTIYEVKTHNNDKSFLTEKGLIPTTYWRQCQIQMYAMRKELKTKDVKLYIVSYGLLKEEYDNYFLPVDPKRIKYHPVAYDKDWINNRFLPNLKELCRALRKGKMPS